MKKIPIPGSNYSYLCDDNMLVHNQFEPIYLKNRGDKKTASMEPMNLSLDTIKAKTKQIKQLIFESTQNCNLRCKYCCYSENYPKNRDFTPKPMTTEVAKKCIDSVRDWIIDRPLKTLAVSFYGGEPLLNFDMMRNTVAYLKERFPGWELSYHMTTNLTILNEEILDFISENQFSVIVSLDGPEEIHDAKRVFTGGKGTFQKVREHLAFIQDKNPQFYDRNVTFITTHAKDLPYDEMIDFFKNDPLVKNKFHRLNMVDENNSIYYENYPYSVEKNSRDLARIRHEILQVLEEKGQLTPIERSLMYNIITMGKGLESEDITSLSSSCVFDSRVYFDAEGDFYICEKVNSNLCIGNMETGFDFEKMGRLLTSFTETVSKNCGSCELKFLCTHCFASIVLGEGFGIDKKLCADMKRSVPVMLKTYIDYKAREN